MLTDGPHNVLSVWVCVSIFMSGRQMRLSRSDVAYRILSASKQAFLHPKRTSVSCQLYLDSIGLHTHHLAFQRRSLFLRMPSFLEDLLALLFVAR